MLNCHLSSSQHGELCSALQSYQFHDEHVWASLEAQICHAWVPKSCIITKRTQKYLFTKHNIITLPFATIHVFSIYFVCKIQYMCLNNMELFGWLYQLP